MSISDEVDILLLERCERVRGGLDLVHALTECAGQDIVLRDAEKIQPREVKAIERFEGETGIQII